MTKFDDLLTILKNYPKSLPANEAHGFLTAANIAPARLFSLPWMQTLLGLPEEVADGNIPGLDRSLIMLSIDEIENQLLDDEDFIPRTSSAIFQGQLLPDTHEWAKGFLRVIELHPQDWQMISEQDLDFARNILGMNVIADPDKYAPLIFGESVDTSDIELIEEIRVNAGPLARSMYDRAMEANLPEVGAEEMSKVINLLHADLSPQNLHKYSNDDLYDQLFIHEDRLPISAVDEFVHREKAMLTLMANYTNDLESWYEPGEDHEIWPLLHHVFILGKMDSPEAARQLLYFFRNSDTDIYDERWEWVDGYWPALFGNKTRFIKNELMQLIAEAGAEDRRLYDYLSVLLCHGSNYDTQALEDYIDLTAQSIQRLGRHSLAYLVANLLMDHPRERHRAFLEKLAKRQEKNTPDDRYFLIDEVENAFIDSDREPEHQRFTNPWKFYEPEEIIERQLRWMEEASCDLPFDDDEDIFDEDFLHDDDSSLLEDSWPDFTPVQTYERETAKLGRNDACPCGSGKKYKKCCLH